MIKNRINLETFMYACNLLTYFANRENRKDTMHEACKFVFVAYNIVFIKRSKNRIKENYNELKIEKLNIQS